MALYVNTNVSSLNGQRNLTNATNSLDTVYKRLSSGLRINSAKDDSAGLQISDRMTSQINGLNQGNRNANDGIAMAQTAEGAMDEITNMLQRIRTLSVQAANGTNTAEDRAAIQQEVTQLSAEITRIACKTTFNGETILNGKDAGLLVNGKISFQVGANANDLLELDLEAGFTLSGIVDTRNNIVGANANGQDIAVDATGLGSISGLVQNTATGDARFSVSNAGAAQKTLETIDSMILAVDSKRAELGGMQNRMESTIRNQSNISQNTSDARSRIRDTDFAEESATLTQQSIIQQAASSMLMQANARPQLALSLLG